MRFVADATHDSSSTDRNKLINADLQVVKIVALQTMAQLHVCDDVLEDIIISFLDHTDATMKVAALDALAALHVTNKKVSSFT